MKKFLSTVLIFTIALQIFGSNIGIAFAKEKVKKSAEDINTGWIIELPVEEEGEISTQDVGWKPKKTLVASNTYSVTQDDVNVFANLISPFPTVAAGISTTLKNLKLTQVGVATYFGSVASGLLSDALKAHTKTGSWRTLSCQTYEFISGSQWIWRYGDTQTTHINTNHTKTIQNGPPFSIYAYGL